MPKKISLLSQRVKYAQYQYLEEKFLKFWLTKNKQDGLPLVFPILKMRVKQLLEFRDLLDFYLA